MNIPSPLDFFSHLVWLDGRPLLDVIEPYRRTIFKDVLYAFDEHGFPVYNFVLAGRGKKNWKTADLIFAALYRFLVWSSDLGNDAFLLANDEGQAADDLTLCKRLIAVNPIIEREVIVKKKEIERKDNGSVLCILPARDIAGAHGKTYGFIGFDEIHEYRDYDLLEALTADPFRRDVLTWITSYNTLYNRPGIPLFDFIQRGKSGADAKMYFSWYGADFTTDPALENAEPEAKANPSMESWGNPRYLELQKLRLPSHKYRRLHLNLPGMPEGAYFDAERVMDCVVEGRRALRPQEGIEYVAYCDMSGGSNDDACLGIAHLGDEGEIILDLVINQGGRPPFNPRDAIKKFARTLREYQVGHVTGDKYGGETFIHDFQAERISYTVSRLTAHQIYETVEPFINAGEVQLLDEPRLYEQILGLTVRGTKITHLPGEHDDWCNAGLGAIALLKGAQVGDGEVHVKLPESLTWAGTEDFEVLQDLGIKPGGDWDGAGGGFLGGDW